LSVLSLCFCRPEPMRNQRRTAIPGKATSRLKLMCSRLSHPHLEINNRVWRLLSNCEADRRSFQARATLRTALRTSGPTLGKSRTSTIPLPTIRTEKTSLAGRGDPGAFAYLRVMSAHVRCCGTAHSKSQRQRPGANSKGQRMWR